MNLMRWEPLREMDEFFRQYSPILGRSLLRNGNDSTSHHWAPAANISETEKEYLIKAELPEVSKEDVSITLENDVITISGERKLRKEDKDENTLRIESFYGSFSRSFQLPQNVDVAGIKAESKDGVLRVRVPKKELPQNRAINIEVK
jgi:HSP20 family protein